jgi:hypothetical protein
MRERGMFRGMQRDGGMFRGMQREGDIISCSSHSL